MAFSNIREIVRSVELGRMHLAFVHKTSVPTPGANRWADCSMGAGTPIYNAYVGGQYEATPMIGQKNQGIYTGPNPPAGMQKHLAQVAMASPTTGGTGAPYTALIADYLMFYPLIDGDSTDQQDMDNVAPLPRYADGVGVQMMLVVTTPMTTSGTVQVNVTTADDVDVTLTVPITVSGTVGVVINTAVSNISISSTPFAPLQGRGIKRVNWVMNLGSFGGFYAVVLVKPLTSLMIREPLTMTEHSLIHHKAALPRIYDGAYINFMLQASTGGTGNPGVMRGELDFIWG